MWPEDFYKLSTRKVNMEKKDERQIIETTIREAQEVIDKAKKSLSELDVTYSVGDRFYYCGNQEDKRILAEAPGSSRVQMNKLSNGVIISDGSFVVNDIRKITQGELNMVINKQYYTRYWDSQKKINTGE